MGLQKRVVGHPAKGEHPQMGEEPHDQKGWCLEVYKPNVWSKKVSLALKAAEEGGPRRERVQETSP